jgi:diguanylate cyclase (GGDEF)-like protein/PAS domain S-box-containing protein
MAANETVIRLLLVEDQLEDAEQLISILRNGGIAVRPQRPTSIEELVAQLNDSPIDMVLASLDATRVSFGDTMKAVNASGKDIPVIATATELDEDRVVAALLGGARDIALCGRAEHLRLVVRNEFGVLEHRRNVRRLEAALHESERRCNSLINSSRDPIAYVHEGMHIRANEAYLEMFGYESFMEVEGLPLLDMVAQADADRFKQLLKDLAHGVMPPRELELRAHRADGSDFDATMEFAQANYEGEVCLQIIIRQRAVDAEMARELDELRYRDQTTGLFNRRYFLEQLENAVASAAAGRNDQLLLLIEPDHYSNLLADIGIGHTDELLARLGGRLRDTVGDTALCALFSDHGFAVLKTDCAPAYGVSLADRIRAAFEGFIVEAGERSVNITVSIGGVQMGEKIARLQEVLGKAGQAVNSCIGLGGNRVEIFDPSARDRAETERIAAWVDRIQKALANNDFVLHYQPIISLAGLPGETYEVFVRMKFGSGEIAPPQSFLAIAEEHGLLDDIDRWVVARAIEVLAERKKANKQTTLFVKVTHGSVDPQETQGTWRVRRPSGAGDSRIEGVHQSARGPGIARVDQAAGLPDRAGAIWFGAELLPVAQPYRSGIPEDRPRVHDRPGQDARESTETARDHPKGPRGRQTGDRRIRPGCGQHVGAVLRWRGLRGRTLPRRRRPRYELRLRLIALVVESSCCLRPLVFSANKKPAIRRAFCWRVSTDSARGRSGSNRTDRRVAQRFDALGQRRMAHEQSLESTADVA